MTQYEEIVSKQLNWEVPFKRNEAFPIDRSSVFTSFDELKEYVLSRDSEPKHPKGVPYIGQVLSVSTENGVTVYKIEDFTESGIIEIENKAIAGNGIEVEDNKISVKVSEIGTNFIESDANGIAVKSVNTDKTLTTEAITIEGGPLASSDVKKAFKDGIIPAGSNIQDILKALLCVEIYPQPTPTTPTCNVSIANPSVTANFSKDILVEVGQKIKINAVTANEVTINSTNTTKPSVKPFNHGYSTTIDGNIITSTAITKDWVIEQSTNEEKKYYKLTPYSTGFTGSLPEVALNEIYSSCQLNEVELIANKGVNTYKVTESAPEYFAKHDAIDSYYIVSNLGGRSEERKSPSIAAISNISKTANSSSGSYSVYGVYPIWTNGISASTNVSQVAAMGDLETPITGDGTKLALCSGSTAFAISFAAQSKEPYRIFVETGITINSVFAFDTFTGNWDSKDYANKFVKTGTTTREVQNNVITYSVYEWNTGEGANIFKITLNQ